MISPSLRGCACAALAVLVLGSASHPCDARETKLDPRVWELPDGGQLRSFRVACDELHCRPSFGRAHPVAIEAEADFEATGRRAAAMRDESDGADFQLVLYRSDRPVEERYRRIVSGKMAVRFREGVDGEAIRKQVGAESISASRPSGLRILTFSDGLASLQQLEVVEAMDEVVEAHLLIGKKQRHRFLPNDTLLTEGDEVSYQWHLHNSSSDSWGNDDQIDINVDRVWDRFRGSGIRIGVVDDGVDLNHPDLRSNIDTANDYNWNDGTSSSGTYRLDSDNHGTLAAGLIAAKGNNGRGVSGVAFESRLTSLRLISGEITDDDEAAAILHRNNVLDIKSNSWGPFDDVLTTEGPGELTAAAFEEACRTGRGGLGTLLVWAGGNGAEIGDNSNFDGYANSIHTIAVGAVSDFGRPSWFSEGGANIVVAAPSGGGGEDLTTTDLSGAKGLNPSGWAYGEFQRRVWRKKALALE
ncbi:MAG: S8 family serine peptidase [Verrucomicrobiota bacterium]